MEANLLQARFAAAWMKMASMAPSRRKDSAHADLVEAKRNMESNPGYATNRIAAAILAMG